MGVLPFERAYTLAKTDGVAVASGRGLVRVTGPQRVWFLQNTITNDVESVPPGSWVESCFLDLKGKVVAHFRVGVADESMWLDVDPPGTAPLVEWFVRNRFRTKVETTDATRTAVCVVGPRARRIAEASVFDEATLAFGGTLGEVATADVHGDAALDDLPRAGAELVEVLRIEAGVPRFGVDYGPATLPQEAGLTQVVSVTKGCYIGQEVVARLHFRGHVNRTVRPLALDGADAPVGRALLKDGRPVGSVTSFAVSPDRGPVGIGMVRVEVEAGESVDVEGGGSARVGPLPAGTKTAAGPPA